MTHQAAAERRELAETLRRLDPGAPTVCVPWTAADLAAHLVLRGRSARYAWAQARDAEDALRQQRRLAAKLGYPALVDEVERIGALSPARIGPADDAVNLIEYVVHHEDLRRVGTDWSPRSLPADRQAALWRHLRMSARTVFRGSIAGLSLRWDEADAVLDGARPVLTVTGSPVELTLVALGRARVARLELDGPAEEIARFQEQAQHPR